MRREARLGSLVVLVSSLSMTLPATGHVLLDAPNGGERLVSGSTFVILWHVEVEHELENWDLWYSTSGAEGPWIPIAMDLPAGDPTAGSAYEYEWAVPDVTSNHVRVRVQQDNVAKDYTDESDGDLAITPASTPGDVDGNGVVDVEDLLAVILGWGACPPPPDGCTADVTGDGVVDADDLVAVILGWTGS